MRRMIGRRLGTGLLVSLALLLSSLVHAATFDILVDKDRDPATGCNVVTPSGTFFGAEMLVRTTIDTSVYPPMVTGVTRQECLSGPSNFGPVYPLDAGGWPIGIGSGVNGYDVLETYFPPWASYGAYRLGFVYGDTVIGSDAVFTTNGQVGGAPIVFDLGPVPVIPTLAHGALFLLAFALAWFALRRLRQYKVSALVIAGVLATIVAGTTWASIFLDGLIGDWAGVPQLATDPVGDAPGGADIAAIFVKLEGLRVYVRADVKTASPPSITSANATTFTVGTAGNFPITTFGIPAVNSITQTGTLPAGVSFVYTAGQSTAALSGTPGAGTGGVYALTLGALNGVPPPASQSFTLTVNQAPAITSAAATAFIVGTPGTYTFTATGFPKPALTLTNCSPALPGGLTFTDNGNGSATLAGSAALGSVGVKNCTLTASNGVGAPVTQPFALTINRAPTTTTVVSNANPSVIGQNVTLTATVIATAPGTGTPTGTIQFMDGAGTLGAPQPLVAGVASFSTSALILGPHPISAVYSSDVDFTASTGSLPTQTVNKAATTTVVTASPNPTVFGQPVTFTATVTTNPPGSGTPTGSVTFSIDGNPQTAALNGSGVATFTTAALAAGPHPVGATYNGDANYNTSTGTLPTQTVNKADTGAVLVSAPNPSVFGQSVALTATVTATGPGAGIPTGTVSFFDGVNPIGSAPLVVGVATLNTAGLSTNAHMLSAQYAGDTNFNSSTSNTAGQTVNKANTTTQVVSSANPSLFSQPVTFTATVAAVAPGAGTPTGTVTFRDGANPLCSAVALAGGTAGCTLSTLAVGPHSIAVDYNADSNFNASTSSALPQTVNGAPTTTTLNPGAATVFGQNATLTATVTIGAPGTAVPTGSVDFKEGATTLGSGTLDGAGVATFSTTAFTVGAHNLTAVYVGNPSFLTSSGTAIKQVNQASTTTALGSNSNPSLSGGSVTFTATVAAVAPGAGIPTGTVQFKDGVANLGGPASLNGAGQAQVNTSALTPGTHSITAIYGGDTGFTGSGSTALNQIVNLAPAFTSAAGTTFTVGAAPGSFPVTASGYPAPILSAGACLPALPGGVGFVGSGTTTMSIAGAPPAGSGGTYACALTAGNGIGSDATQNFVLTIDEAPTAVADPGYTVLHGTTLTVTAGGMPDGLLGNDARGFPPATITSFGGGSLGGTVTTNAAGTPVMFGPGHLLQVNADGSFSFAAAAGTYGPVTFQYRLHNTTAPDSDGTVTIGILKAPLFTSANSTAFQPSVPGTFTVTTSGFPAPSLGASAFAPSAPWLTFNDNGNGTATLAGTAPANATGTITFTITAHNIIAPDATQNFTLHLNTPPTITSANATTFTTGTPGSFSVTTTGFPTGASMLISKSGALPAGTVAFTNNNDGTATLAGTAAAGAGGVFPLVITANNGVAPNATQNFTLTVNDAPGTPSGPAVLTYTVGAPGTASYSATGYPAPTFTLTGCALPGSVTMSSAGTLSGTPVAGDGGNFNCTVNASNGIGSPSTLAVLVHIVQAPAITSANNATFQTGTPGSFTVTTTGFPTGASMVIAETGVLPGFSVTGPKEPVRGGPVGLKVVGGVSFVDNHNGTATLSGVPGPTSGGTYPLIITANNGVAPQASQNFTLTVNQAPAFTSAAATTFTVGVAPAPFAITATGFPAPVRSVGTCVPTLPAGVAFTGSGTTSMSLSGTPPAGSGGTYACPLTASNGVGSNATQNFVLTIDEAPAAVADPGYTVLTGATLAVTVGGMPDGLLANDTAGFPAAAITSFGGGSMGGAVTDHAVGAPVTFGPGHSLQVNADGSFTFVAAAGSFGNVTFQYRLHNSTADSDATVTIGVLKAPLITSPATASFLPGSPGTFTVTTSGFPAPSLAAGAFAPAAPWLSFTDNGNGTATLAGTPPVGATGSILFTITAHNIIAPDATQNFTLQLNTPPAITSANATTFTTGTFGTFTVTTTGFPTGASMLISESGTLPTFPSGLANASRAGKVGVSIKSSVAGVTFNNNFDGTATMSGVPTAGHGGVYPLVITANNGVAPNATQNFTLTVNDAPGVPAGSAVVTFKVGSPGSSSYTATGYPAPTFTLTGCALPPEITMSASGTLSGTPVAGTGGDFNCTVTASNGIGVPGTLPVVVHIQQAPTITSANATTFTTGTFGTFTVTTTGFPTGAAMVITSSGTLPSLPNTGLAGRAIKVGTPNPPVPGVTFTNNLNGTATLSGVASPGNGGVYALNFTANNGVTPNGTQAFTLTVNDAPGTPSGSASVNFLVGTAGSTGYTATGYPAPTFTLTGCTLPGTLAMSSGGTLSGTAPVGSGGDFNCSVNASNGIGSPSTLPIVVHVQQPPAITSANATTFTAGSFGTFTVTTTGFPTGASMVISQTGALPGVSVTGPKDPVRGGPVTLKSVGGVTFVDNHNGTATLSGVPGPTSGGTYTLNITANNGVAPPASQTFTLTVNQAPTITSANNTAFKIGTAGSFTVTTSGFPTGASMALSATGALPAGVTFTDNGNGTAALAGTPSAGSSGSYPLTITAINGLAPNGTQSFTLTVQEPPAITNGASTTFTVGVLGSFQFTATGFPASFTFSTASPLPAGVTLTTAGVLSGTPGAGTAKSWVLSVTASNGVTPDAVQSFTLTVNQAPAITSANAASFTALQAGTFTVTTTGSPVSALSKTTALPSGVTFVDNGDGTATIAGTPAAGTQGNWPTVITANNGVLPNATQNFTLTVLNTPPAVIASPKETFDTVGNIQLEFKAAPTLAIGFFVSGNLVANFSDPDGPAALTAIAVTNGATANGGTVTIATNGEFTYTPKAGDTAASDTFTYQVTDGMATTAARTVTVNRVNRVWFVKNNAAGGGQGRANDPFNTLAAAQTASLAGDTIFVWGGDLTTAGQTAGFTMKANQKLYGEAFGLTIAGTVNGIVNPVLVASGGNRPLIDNTAAGGDGVLASNIAGVEIRGLSIGGIQHAVNVNTTAAGSGSATITDNVIRLPGIDGIHVASGGSGTLTVAIQRNNVTGAARGISAQKTAGTLTITAFDNNSVSGNTTGTGVDINGAVFDATPGNPITTVSGGGLSVGASGNGVGTSGVLLQNVTGDLVFTDLDIYNDAGTGLLVSSTAALNAGAGTGFRLVVGSGVSTIDSNGGPAIDVSNASFNLPSMVFLRSTNSTTTGVSLVNAFGGAGLTTLSASSGQISDPVGASGTAFNVSGGTGIISFPGPITNSSGNSVVVTGRTGDSVSFSGAISDTGSGISLTSNTGATISFTGALTLSTGTNNAFVATGGGTVSSSDTTSTITTTTGTAVNIANTAIGASGVKFRSVTAGTAASGPTNGIVVNNVGIAGAFTVSGTGSAASGGTIQKTGAEGVLLTGPANVSLSWMNIKDFGTHGVSGSGVRDLTIANSTLSDAAGNNTTDDGIHLSNTSGTLAITNTTVTNARHQGITIDNFNTNMASLSLTGSSVTGTPGGDGVLIQMRGTSVMTTGTISGNTFSSNSATGLQVNNADTGNIASLSILSNTVNANNAGIDLDLSQASSMTVTVQSNTITNSHSQALNLVTSTSATGGSMTATLRTNNIGTAGVNDSGSAIGNGIRVANGGMNVNLTIDGNIIREVPNGRGIDIEPQAYTPNLSLKAKIINNQIVRPTGTNQNIGCGANVPCPSASIFVLSDSNGLGGFDTVCTVISGNTAYDPTSWAAGGEAAFYFARRTSASNLLRLEGTQANVTAQIQATNTITNLTAAGVVDENTSGTVAIVPTGTCGSFPP